MEFRTSTWSGGGEQCVQVAARRGSLYVRDSKDPDGPMLQFTPDEWTAFVKGVKDGEFDEFD